MNVETRMPPAARSANIEIVPTDRSLGAEIRNVDLRQLDDAAFAAVLRAFHTHSVLLVRGQHLSDQDLIAFSRRFGDLDWAPVQENGRRFVEGLPEIYIVSNVKVNGEAIGSLGAGEAVWHTDMSYLETPPIASALYALEIPPVGGNTSFCSMYAVYDALPTELKHRIADLKIKHDGTYNSGGFVRQGSAAGATPIWSAWSSPSRKRCLMNYGPMSRARSSPGSTSGRLAISSSGTTAPRCIDAIRSTIRRGESCTEPRSREQSARSDSLARQICMIRHRIACK